MALLSQPTFAQEFSIAFFGDTFLSRLAIEETESTVDEPKVFAGVQPLLRESTLNVVNLEGVMTEAFVPFELKRYVLPMPRDSAFMMQRAGIQIATLANNHAMDFGSQGLFDTLHALEGANIRHVGAEFSLEAAKRPLKLEHNGHKVCLIPLSRTLPQSFWATKDKPGTAALSFEETAAAIKQCAEQGYVTIAIFHWGEELTFAPKKYQRSLAKLAIKSGAAMVIGHHPHVVQDIDFVDDRPIFYSLGNFAFGTLSSTNFQEGMGVRLIFRESRLDCELIPLAVNNRTVNFVPRQLNKDEEDPVARSLPVNHPCHWSEEKRRWHCRDIRLSTGPRSAHSQRAPEGA